MNICSECQKDMTVVVGDGPYRSMKMKFSTAVGKVPSKSVLLLKKYWRYCLLVPLFLILYLLIPAVMNRILLGIFSITSVVGIGFVLPHKIGCWLFVSDASDRQSPLPWFVTVMATLVLIVVPYGLYQLGGAVMTFYK